VESTTGARYAAAAASGQEWEVKRRKKRVGWHHH